MKHAKAARCLVKFATMSQQAEEITGLVSKAVGCAP